MLRDRCGFKTAVQRLGAWDSTDYDATTRAERNRQCRERRQKQERFESAANKLAEMENSLRLDFCDQIHACDRILAEPGPHWTESQWQRAHAAQVLRDEYLLPVYTLLAWGSLRQRAEYVLADDRNRIELAAAVMRAGGVRDDNNRWREVLA